MSHKLSSESHYLIRQIQESVFYDIGGVYYDYKDGDIVPVEELGQDLKIFLHVSQPR